MSPITPHCSDARRRQARTIVRFLTALLPMIALAAVFVGPVTSWQDRGTTPIQLVSAGLQPAETSDETFADLRARAEAMYDEHSYGRAHDLYEQAQAMTLSPEDRRWVEFRLADTTWRSQTATNTRDDTVFSNAQKELQKLIDAIDREVDRGRVWAEAQESLADLVLRNRRRYWDNTSEAWSHYQAALDWWAGSDDINLARTRYLSIVWRMCEPVEPGMYVYQSLARYMPAIPVRVLRNARQIADNDNDRAKASFFLALEYRRGGARGYASRIVEELYQSIIDYGRKNDWYDDALYHYASWLSQEGRPVVRDDGTWTNKLDYVKAIELYQRIVTEFRRDETRYYDDAAEQIKQITSPQLSVMVSNVFLPGSEIGYHTSYRNVERITFELREFNLRRDVEFTNATGDPGAYLQRLDRESMRPVMRWTHDAKQFGTYEPVDESLVLKTEDGKPLPTGAYMLFASAGGKSDRTLVLVSDLGVIVKTAGDQLLAYVTDAEDGAPIANADVRMWMLDRYDRQNEPDVFLGRDYDFNSNADGLVHVNLDEQKMGEPTVGGNVTRNAAVFMTAEVEGRQAIVYQNLYSWYYQNQNAQEDWRIYVFTDRPAYRPGDTVQWKAISRMTTGGAYETPAGREIKYSIVDSRGNTIKEETAKLNDFGSMWGLLDVTGDMPLGEFNIRFESQGKTIGGAQLFRLEEYKLPEFKVSVESPKDDQGRPKVFRVGETVEATVKAEYYFGGPVASADVEVIVRQKQFTHYWSPPHKYPWYYEDRGGRFGRGWGWNYEGDEIKREQLKTDAEGRAVVTIDTPTDSTESYEYTIEARVVDSSRREVTGKGKVRVTQQSYYVYPDVDHYLYQPGDNIEVRFKAMDPNDNAREVTGKVNVLRKQWVQIWIDPTGREVPWEEVRLLRAQNNGIFPPPDPNRPHGAPSPGWQLKFEGYEHEKILERELTTDPETGEATLEFKAPKVGYYEINWTSPDPPTLPVTASTTVWVTNRDTTNIGYHEDGVQIIVDKDTFRVGEKAPVMIVAPTNERYALFTVEGRDLHHYEVVHLTGMVKLVQLEIGEEDVPNVWLDARMVHDGRVLTDTERITIPPVKHFLNVEVKSSEDVYEPRDEGTLTIQTTDVDGRPVSAEVAIALIDESVYYIQQEYAGDPREFFFNQQQPYLVTTFTSFDSMPYVRLVKGFKDKDLLIDERSIAEFTDKEMQLAIERGEVSGSLFDDAVDASVNESLAFGEGAAPAARMRGGAQRSAGRAEMQLGKAAAPAESEEVSFWWQDGKAGGVAGEEGEQPAVVVRSDFRATALWMPAVKTDADGKATVDVKYPDTLTTWKATARAMTTGNQTGIGDASTKTRKPLIARLQAPRFFVVGDAPVISAVVNNNTDEELEVGVMLEIEGGLASQGPSLRESPDRIGPQIVKIPANSEARVDWPTTVKSAGDVKLRVTARSSHHADAMELSYPIVEHGIDRLIVKSGKVRGNDVTVNLHVPAERKKESTELVVQVTPSMAVTMLDALPYLIDYPYGCTEQTMSRFLPTVVTMKTLNDLGVSRERVASSVFGGIEEGAAEHVMRDGKRDLAMIDAMTDASLKRLYDMQHDDGGWGWWKQGNSDHYMSAYVVWGLALARNAGVEIDPSSIERGVRYLEQNLVEAENAYDLQAWMLHALATAKPNDMAAPTNVALQNVWDHRDRLNAYTMSLYALAAHAFGKNDRAQILVRNLENGVKIDNQPDQSVILRSGDPNAQPNPAVIATAHWGADRIWYRWSDGGVESTAFVLRAMLAIDPQNKLIEPVTNWLIKNRRGAQWSNTRDTAITVLALNDYLRTSGELDTGISYDVIVNGEKIASKELTKDEIIGAPSRFVVNRELIKDGANTIRIVRRDTNDKGAIYFSAEASFFSLEEPIPASGNEIFVRRQYYKLVPKPTLLKGFVMERIPLDDGDSIRSGERVEVVMTVEAKNNYEYLVFEDLKPAGFEAVEVRSGEGAQIRELKSGAVNRQFGEAVGDASREIHMERDTRADYTGASRWVHQEWRDRLVAMFVDRLPEGVWEIRYELRAEVPGSFHALPLMAHAMYVPEIKANGKEIRVTVLERAE